MRTGEYHAPTYAFLFNPTHKPPSKNNLKPKYRNVARSADESSAVLRPASGTHFVRCSPHSENIKNCSVVGKGISFRRTSISVQAQSGRERPFPPCVYLPPRSCLSSSDFKDKLCPNVCKTSIATHLAALQLRSRLPSGLVGLCSAYYC